MNSLAPVNNEVCNQLQRAGRRPKRFNVLDSYCSKSVGFGACPFEAGKTWIGCLSVHLIAPRDLSKVLN